MPIYDIDGNEIFTAYDMDGASLSEVYDIDGNLLNYDEPVIIDDIDLTNVESYFVQDVRDAMAYVKNLGYRDWVHHLVTTDNHYIANYNHVVPIIEAMQTSGYFGKIINIGDVADNGSEASYTKAAEQYSKFNGNLLFAAGNHDHQFDGWQQYWVNNLLSRSTDISDPSSLTYYYDDTRHKIRYIVYNCLDSATFNNVLTWLKSMNTGWSAIVFSHYAGMPFVSDYNGTDRTTNHLANGKATEAEVYFLLNKDVNFIGWISGHEHVDSLAQSFIGATHQAVLMNDGWINDASLYTKTKDTNTEQAITIMSVNTKLKEVKFYRIGQTGRYGKQFGYSYQYTPDGGHWVRGYFINSENKIAQGATSGNAESLMYSVFLPTKDTQGNALRYQVYTKSGTPLAWIVKNAVSSNGTQTRCSGGAVREGVHSFGLNWGMGSTSAQNIVANSEQFLICVSFNVDTVTEDDVVISTTPCDMSERVGETIANVEWLDDTYMSSGWATASSTEGTATSRYIKVDAGAQYRLSIDDTGYAKTNPWTRVYAYDNWFVTAQTLISQSNGGSNSLPFTFTVPSDCHLIRISISGLTGYTGKVRLEKI